jgi:hypothetical protein
MRQSSGVTDIFGEKKKGEWRIRIGLHSLEF